MRNRYLSFLPIPALIIIIASLHATVKPTAFYDPGWLIAGMNTIFITLICFVVSFIALINYRSTGRVQILLLGCGVLIFGVGGAVAGFVRDLPDGANLNVTIYNTGAFVGALFHASASLILISGISPDIGSKRKSIWLAVSYFGVFVFMALLTLASIKGLLPPFFIQGQGATPIRQAILGSADVLFAFTFLVFLAVYVRNKEVFLYWYSLALALTSISLSAFLIQQSVGSPVGWAGRSSQYLAGVYFLIALTKTIRSADERRTSFTNVFTSSLSPLEEKFRLLAENSPDIIDRIDSQMRHLYVNLAGVRFYGKPLGSIIGKTIDADVPEPYRSQWEAHLRQVFATGQPFEAENYYQAPDGWKYYHSRLVPEFSADGSVTSVLVVSRDITDRIKAETGLLESEERYRCLVEQAVDGIFMADARGRYIDVNSAGAQMLGYSREEICGLAATDVILPGETARMPGQMSELKSGMVVTNEWQFRRKDGSTFTGEVVGRQLPDGRLLGILRDVTARKQAEQQSKLDLDAMTRLNRLGTLFVREGNLKPVLDEIVDAAIAISGSDFGNIQLLNPASGELKIVSHRGFPQWWIDFWETVSKGQGTCGTALERGNRVIVEDVEQSPIFIGTPGLEIQRRAGVRAVVSTPLKSRSGVPLGMFSTHFKTPKRPDDRTLQLLDLLARNAADIIDYAQKEESLRESEERLRVIAQAAHIGFFEWNASKDTAYWSLEQYEIFGFEPYSPITSDRWLKGVHPEDRERVMQNRVRLLERGRAEGQVKGHKDEYRFIHDDGSVHWLESNLSLEMMEDEPILRGTVWDVTERKQAEEALRESEKQKAFLLRLSDTLHPLRDPVAMQEATSRLTSEYLDIGRITYCEVRYEPDVIVYVARDWPRRAMPSLAGGRYRMDDFGPFLAKTLTAGRISTVADAESEPSLSSGERDNWRAIGVVSNCSIPVMKEGTFVSYLTAQDNRPHYWSDSEIKLLEHVADISWTAVERANAEAALRESENRFQSMSQFSPAMIVITRISEGTLLFTNPTFDSAFGFAAGELIGRKAHELYANPKDRQELINMVQLNGSIQGREVQGKKKDGTIFWISASTCIINFGSEQVLLSAFLDITERKRAEEKLRESEERISRILASIQDDFYVLNRGWVFEFASQRFTSRIGKNPEDFVGKNIWEMFPKHVGTSYEENLRAVMNKREIRRFEMHGQYTDSWYGMTVFPSAGGITCLGTDITERRKAEIALRESEEMLRTLIDTAPMPVQTYGPDGIVKFWNSASEKLYGYTAQEALGRNLGDLIIPPELQQLYHQALQLGGAKTESGEFQPSGEVELLRKDGTRVTVYSAHTAICRKNQPPMLFCLDVDLTKHKRAEIALRESEQRFALSMEATSDGLWDWDATTDEVYYSPGYYRILGFEPGGFPSTLAAWKERVHPEDLERALQVNMDCVNGRTETFTIEYRLQAATGEWRWILGRGKCITRDARGRAIRLIGTHMDITERKQAEEDLKRLNDELMISNKELDAFAYSVSHDLRAPLRSMEGFAKMLTEDHAENLDSTGRDYIGRIRGAAERMAKLIEDLLRLSHITRQESKMTGYDLSNLASSVVRQLQEADPKRKVDVVIQDGLRARVDPDLMKIAITNLLA
ncbi:MAG TPA: PAS domain S-box protein, partial [Dissulfurispiraceae bacterium]|nr:PAS domain S-box protein [Dissulfurispiraceae bacterium]